MLGACMLIEHFHPYIGGAERQLQARIGALRRRGVDVAVITRRDTGLAATSLVAGAHVARVSTRGGRIARSMQYTLGVVWALVRMRHSVQIVYAYSPFSPATAALCTKALLGRPVVVQLLGGGPPGALAVLDATRLGRLRLAALRRGVDRFVALSGELERELIAAGVPANRIVRVPNGVDTGHFRPADTTVRQALRERLGLGGRPVALYVGRLVPYKGLETLLEAWHLVLRELPSALLLIVGEGPLASTLEAQAVPNVRFEGPALDPLPYYQAVDCFVLPSHGEGMPSALLEAMAVGLPCVATSVGGIPDALRAEVDGWLVPPGDPGALATALGQALSSGPACERAAAAREHASRAFSLEQTADKLVELFRMLASSAGKQAE
jgi:glycosyltransferase involved in cell wall biosynthesis